MRDFVRALPVADLDVTGRIIEGQALRWNKPYRVSDDGRRFYSEGWRRGQFAEGLRATGNNHELRVDHRDVRVGMVSFDEGDVGLRFEAVADTTELGELALQEAKAGKFRGVSIRYASAHQRRDAQGVIWRQRGRIRELSLVRDIVPQYEDGLIEAMRAGVATQELLDRTAANLAIEIDW
jgi:HK97 family phage prohead protease